MSMSHEYERVASAPAALRLHLNENTSGCSPRVLAALQAVTREQAAFYPDYERATEACALRLGVTPAETVLTNGLDEGILAVSMAALRSGRDSGAREAVIAEPAFDMYASCADASGATLVHVPPAPGLEFQLDQVLDAITPGTAVVFLTTPNNPTGMPVARDAILQVAARASHAMVLVDEAYADFAGTTLIGDPALEGLPNVIIGRTFAKAYGLAGLRLGALVASPPTIDQLRRVLPPYSVNAYAVAATQAAFEDLDYYDWYLGQVAESKALLSETLSRLGVKFWPSAANFVLAYFGDESKAVLSGLKARGIVVRDRSADPGCAGCIRITAGVVAHTRACVAALEEVLCGAR
jgi:histidinol-phosphate aminotransferase